MYEMGRYVKNKIRRLFGTRILLKQMQQAIIKQEQTQAINFYHANNYQKSTLNPIDPNRFLLFHYFSHCGLNGCNLGDYVQTIALKSALDRIYSNPSYEFFDRNLISYYQNAEKKGGVEEKIISIMQGWFAHGYYFIPSASILPVFVGTHFTKQTQDFLLFFLAHYPHYFDNLEVGCRDEFTLDFCQKYNISSYFSRCITLTLHKRESKQSQNKIFFVDVPQEFLVHIPKSIKQNAIHINQRWVTDKMHWEGSYNKTSSLLETYANEAKLIITSALHCASPCTALGIPVILVQNDSEQLTRFSALKGILKPYNLQDFEKQQVDFAPNVPDIEPLKQAMLKNLHLNIQKALNKQIDTQDLQNTRKIIADFGI